MRSCVVGMLYAKKNVGPNLTTASLHQLSRGFPKGHCHDAETYKNHHLCLVKGCIHTPWWQGDV
jgi:hypothetical protein